MPQQKLTSPKIVQMDRGSSSSRAKIGNKRSAAQAGLGIWHKQQKAGAKASWAQPVRLSRAWKNVLLSPSVPFLSVLQSEEKEEEAQEINTGSAHDEIAPPRRRPRSRSIVEEARRPPDVQHHYEFILRLPPYEQAMRAFPKTPLLPNPAAVHKRKKTLVLDLDETLCHSASLPLDRPADIEFEVNDIGGKKPVYSYKRPYMEEFLQWVSQLFEVVVFTAAQQEYGEQLLSKLDNTHLLEHKLYRDSCRFVKGAYVKDLNVLGRNLNEIILIDDALYSFSYQIDNGIPIKGWYGDAKDKALLHLIPFLMVCRILIIYLFASASSTDWTLLLQQLSKADCTDVRPKIREKYRISHKLEEAKQVAVAQA